MNIAAGVLWDMDGTLIDSEPIALDALYMALSEVGVAAIPGLHDRVLGLPADEIYAWLVAEHGLSEDWVSWERPKHRHHLAGADRLRVFPDALKVFRVLETAGVPQAIVSNSDRIIMDAQLGRLELSRPGLVTVSRNDVRKGKPEPEGYLRAALLLGCDPAACYVVEDSASGITAGRAAGATTCAVPHASTGLGADVTLREMEEILDLLGLR